MQCPYCAHINTKVLDSRTSDESIRRRRECDECEKRFTTYERVELMDISIVKKDGTIEPFDRDKVLKGILIACEKRKIKREKIDEIVSEIEQSVRQMDSTEVKSRKIGELVMNHLRNLDDVAYVRFASVYKKFRDANQFVTVVKGLKEIEVRQ